MFAGVALYRSGLLLHFAAAPAIAFASSDISTTGSACEHAASAASANTSADAPDCFTATESTLTCWPTRSNARPLTSSRPALTLSRPWAQSRTRPRTVGW